MKFRLLKAIKFLMSFAFILGIGCANLSKATWQIIETPSGNTLKISGVQPGKLHDELQAVTPSNNQLSVVIEGVMNDSDFRSLTSKALIRKYKSIDLKDVTATVIPRYSFSENKYLECFVCPKNLIAIEGPSFLSCVNLRIVVFPGTLKTIGANCFEFCGKLEVPVPRLQKS